MIGEKGEHRERAKSGRKHSRFGTSSTRMHRNPKGETHGNYNDVIIFWSCKMRDKTLLSFTVLVDLKFQGFISGMTS